MPKRKQAAAEAEYEVERIVDVRGTGGRKEYRLHWKGYAEEEDTWEPVKNLDNIKAMIDSFLKGRESSATPNPTTAKQARRQKSAAAAPAPTPPPAWGTQAAPKLLCIQRKFAVEDAAGAVRLLSVNKAAAEAEILDGKKELRKARKAVREAEGVVAASRFKSNYQDALKDGRLARKRAREVEATVEQAKESVKALEAEITTVTRDEQPDDVRVLKRLEDELGKSDGLYGKVDKMGNAAMHDLAVLHAAGLIDDAPLRRASEMLIGCSRPGLVASAVQGLASLTEANQTAASLGALQALCDDFIMKRSAIRAPLISIAKALVMPTLKTSPTLAQRFLDHVLERAAAMAKAASVPKRVESGVAGALHAMLDARKQKVDPLAGIRRECPMLGLMLPVLTHLRRAPPTSAAHKALRPLIAKLEAALRERLKAAGEVAIPEAADCSMPEAATKIGGPDHYIAAFLASSTERELRINAGRTGRMHIHHFLEDKLGYGSGVSHESEGFGAERVLVLRKTGFPDPTELALRRKLQAVHVETLRDL